MRAGCFCRVKMLVDFRVNKLAAFFRLSWRVGFFRVELLVDFWVVWAFVFLG